MKTLMKVLAAFLLVFGIAGCKSDAPTDTVVMSDVSQSIERSAVLDEFRRIDGMIDQMQRGDTVTIVPITGDAMSDLPGHILRFTAPTDRQPYDHDLMVFREQAHKCLHVMRSAVIADPPRRTDILGTLDVAKQIFDNSPSGHRKRLIILSDFLEDDGIYRFNTDKRLGSIKSAEKLAKTLREERRLSFKGIEVSAGTVQSKDTHRMAQERLQAVRAFWENYLGLRQTASKTLLWSHVLSDDGRLRP